MKSALLVAVVLIAAGQQARWPAIVEKASPSVVVIETEKALGSGFFVNADGTLVTNHHVIDGAKSIAVKTAAGEVYRGAFLLASDPLRDLAILRIDAFGVKPIDLGDSNDLKVAAPVLLLGAPRGLEQSATDGIISAIRLDDSGTRLIQTSTASNPGNSGGPLLSETGAVIGVLSFGFKKSESLNFAIPINYVRGLLQRLNSVPTAPERRLEPLLEAVSNRSSQPSAPSVSAPRKVSGGIYVTGFGVTDYLPAAYSEITRALASGGIKVVEHADIESVPPSSTVGRFVDAARAAGADGVLYFSLSLGWNQTDRFKVECFDSAGRLVWEEETTSRWQMSYNAAFNAVAGRMREKLRNRAALKQFPGQSTQTSKNPPLTVAPRPAATAAAIWTISLPETTASLSELPSGGLRLALQGRYALTVDLKETAGGLEGFITGPAAACSTVPLKMTLSFEAGGWTGRMEYMDCASHAPEFRRAAFRLIPR